MGKYGSGVSMKSVIEMEVSEVKEILDKSNLTEEDKDTVLNSLKEMAYNWCSSNACSCAMENLAKDIMTEKQYHQWESLITRDVLSFMTDKMRDTFPY